MINRVEKSYIDTIPSKENLSILGMEREGERWKFNLDQNGF